MGGHCRTGKKSTVRQTTRAVPEKPQMEKLGGAERDRTADLVIANS